MIGTERAYFGFMSGRALVVIALLTGCGSGERAPGPPGEHPSGMSAPVSIIGQQGSPTVVTRGVSVREIPSLMRWPTLGGDPPADVAVSFEGVPLPMRGDGRFDSGARFGWFGVQRGNVHVLARVDPIDGELTLPILPATATGMPRPDRAAVVFQLTDNAGNPIVGLTAANKPGVIGPCYDNGTDRVQDVPRATSSRGAIAYLEIPVTTGTFETEINLGGRALVAQVPIVAGTVTFLRTSVQ